jgi:poly(ADP-ribose) glycohydrolase ARH3
VKSFGLFFVTDSEDKLAEAACAAASVTHAHPFGCKGAVLIALATALSYHDTSSPEIIERLCQRAESPELLSRLHIANAWLQAGSDVAPQTVAAALGNGISAVESCVTAVYVALTFRNRSFDELLEFAIRLRGDVDTIAAMAGAIWGVGRGLQALPQARLQQLEQFDRLQTLARSFADSASNRLTSGGTCNPVN